MAKVLSKHMTAADFPAAGTEDQDMDWAKGLVRNIINVQNHQIAAMQAWLDANPSLAGEAEPCYTMEPYACNAGMGALALGLFAMER